MLNRMDAREIIDGFDRILPEQEKALQLAAVNAGKFHASNSPIFTAFTQLQFFVLTVDYDMRVMLRTLLADPQSRVTAEKFLALTLEESDEFIGAVIGDMKKALRSAGNPASTDPAKNAFDAQRFDEVTAQYWADVRPFRDDYAFNKTLREIRNTVAGHIMGKQVGLLNSAGWIASRAAVPRTTDGVMTSQIVGYSVTVLQALLKYSRGLHTCMSMSDSVKG